MPEHDHERHEHQMPPTTHTVELTQLDQLNEALAAGGAPRTTAGDLGLDPVASGVGPGAVLSEVRFEGPPEFPYVHGIFDGHAVELHTAALRALSHRLHLHHVWGV